MATHKGRYPSESPLIVERSGQDLGFLETPLDPGEFSQREERASKVEANIDGLLLRFARLWEMGQRRQRLFEVPDRFPIG